MMKTFTLFLTILTLISCKNNKKDIYSLKKDTSATIQQPSGKKLMEMHCTSCHSVSGSENSRVAPPMIAVKKRYLEVNPTKEQFVKSIIDWSQNPTSESAIMYGAVKKFGVMPNLMYPKKTIKQISEYIYDHEIEQPEWFDEHYKKEKATIKHDTIHNLSYTELGLQYTLKTQSVLGANLMRKIKQQGTIAALEYCNIKAYPLIDSIALSYNATIKRVSDKPRNTNNQASNLEKEYINIFKKDALNQKETEPIIKETSKEIKFYYPIKTNDKCLQCHGVPSIEIHKNTLEQINKLYPNDLAIGYKANEVRGIWSITFQK